MVRNQSKHGQRSRLAALSLIVPTALMFAAAAQADEMVANAWPSIDALTRLTEATPATSATAGATSTTASSAKVNQQAAASNGLIFASAPADAAASDMDQAATTLTIKQNIMVDSAVIKLGDLFDRPVTGGDTPIAQAPKPGQTVTLDARFLRQLVRAYHLDVGSDETFDHILVARKSQMIKSEDVTAEIVQAISDRTGQSNNMDIVFDGGEVQFTLPTNVPATVAIQGLNFDPSNNRFLAILTVPATGPTLYTQQVIGTVYEKTQVPVLKRLVSAGDTIQQDDIDWTSSRVDQLANNTVTDVQQMVGRIAKRPLRPGQVLRMSDLINDPTVHKNDLITIAVQTNNMSLTVRGKALEDGAVGQTIRVVNVNTKRQLLGVVKDASTVLIQPTGALALN
ncbi:MAG TPA: flagellar basal body P-ring formation chaperone FlgA [Terriglobales bacterium]|nr:flagellar basal body P-ring formation chaperone FlgA [Terriglobales bacterium]